MTSQDNSLLPLVDAKTQEFLSRTPFYGHQFKSEVASQVDPAIKKVTIPPLCSYQYNRPIFYNFLEFESTYSDDKGLKDGMDLSGKRVTLTEESQFFHIVLDFVDNETAFNQIKYYKTIINHVVRLKKELTKIVNVFKKNNIHEKPRLFLAASYNDIFPYWADKDSHQVPACYQLDTVYIFVNYKLKCGLRLKETRESLLHELGHMLENRLYVKSLLKNKYSSLVRHDFKLALKRNPSRFLNLQPYASFFDHVAPPTTFTKLNHRDIMSSTASELFAESFSYYIEFHGKSVKRRHNKLILNEMFPNTNYIIKQTVLGKSVNKYKTLKPKKATKRIKI